MTINHGSDWPADKFFSAACWLALFAAFLRAIYFFEHSKSAFFAMPLLDERYYDQMARLIVNGQSLKIFAGFKPVLYPFFLSLVYRLDWASGIVLSVLIQHAFGIATTVIVTVISARLFRNYKAGILSGLIYTLSALPIFFEGEILSESLFIFMACLVLYVHIRALEVSGRFEAAAWIICGAVIALTAQVRSNILIFIGIYPVVSIAQYLKNRRPAAWTPLLALIGVAGTLIIFGAVNTGIYGKYQVIPGAGGINFYLGNNLKSDGMTARQERSTTYGDLYEDSIQVFSREEYRRALNEKAITPANDPSAVSRYWMKRTFNDIAADPVRWLELMAKKKWVLFWNFEIADGKTFLFILEQESRLLRFLPIQWFVLFALAPIGVIAAVKGGDRRALLIIFSFIVFYAAGIIMFLVNSRFRLPLWPAMAVLAGGGLKAIWSACCEKDWRRLALYSVIAVSMAVISLVNWWNVKPESYARDYYLRSIAYYERGQFEKSLRDIQESLMLDPRDLKALLHCGNVFFALKQYDTAKDIYLKVAKYDPGDPRVWNNLGAAYEALKDYRSAYQAYLKALEVKNDNTITLQNLALLEIRAGIFTKAEERISLLESLNKDNVVAINARAFLEKRPVRNSEAEDRWVSEKLSERPIDIGPVR